MEQYTIYCTPEQAKNALELGAPIEVTIENNGFKNRKDDTLDAIDAALEYLENNMPEP